MNGKSVAGRRVVFVDRDNTIAKDGPYCARPEDFELIEGAAEALAVLKAAGLELVVITNQSGVARGYFTESDLHRINAKMERMLAAAGASLLAVYYCPHGPEDMCKCRKPQPGMIEKAADDHGIDPRRCYVIGDRWFDVELGTVVGARTVMVPIEKHADEVESPRLTRPPDFVAKDLKEAARWIVEDVKRKGQ
ncbi:MAG: HAD family hydrolase [Euryarchaeota archaeon]|nr:HAD family hydrolase [Euryarchaeota archaeon]